MSVAGSRRLVLRVCHLHYREGLSHVEIGKRLGLSRFQVARLLRRGLDEGYVVIKILEPERWHSPLERKLERRFALDMAIVVDDDGQGVAEVRRRVADAAGRLLIDLVTDHTCLGISLGRTMQELVLQLPARIPRPVTVVQLIGGNAGADGRQQAPVLAADLAARFATRPYLVHAPALVGDAAIRDALLNEASIQPTFARFRDLDVAFLGIGAIAQPGASRLLYGGVLSPRDVTALRERGAVGDVLAYVYDAAGAIIESGFEQRMLAIPLDDFLRVPRRVGVAAGADKLAAVRGAVRGGLVNTLVTDSTVAQLLCDLEVRDAVF